MSTYATLNHIMSTKDHRLYSDAVEVKKAFGRHDVELTTALLHELVSNPTVSHLFKLIDEIEVRIPLSVNEHAGTLCKNLPVPVQSAASFDLEVKAPVNLRTTTLRAADQPVTVLVGDDLAHSIFGRPLAHVADSRRTCKRI